MMLDPGSYSGEYSVSQMLAMQGAGGGTNGGANHGSYSADKGIDAWVNRAVINTGPVSGVYDPGLASLFSEENA